MFGFLGSLASALIPGAAPIVALASRLFGGGGGGGGGGGQPLVPAEPPPPPPPPFDPRVGTVTPPMPNGMTYGDQPFIGDTTAQPIPMDFGGPGPAGGVIPAFPSGLTELPATSDLGGSAAPASVPGTEAPTGIPGIVNWLTGQISSAGSAISGALGAIPGAVTRYGVPYLAGVATGVVGTIAVERIVSRKLQSIFPQATTAKIISDYSGLRRLGYSHKRARHMAYAMSGIRLKRRRMRPTNVHALRRAIRRVRGARRIMGKVRALHVGGRSFGRPMFRRRHYRRGDLNPFMVEDRLEAMDEWEDAGGEDMPFHGEEAAAGE
jgi:hypothetical protein